MNKKLGALFFTFLLSACSTTFENNDNDVDIIKDSLKEDAFYNVLVGSLMEKNSQNNNAISYYEKFLETHDDEKVYKSLMDLYIQKNDFIGASKLLQKSDRNFILKHYNGLLFAYDLLNNEIDASVDSYILILNNIKNSGNDKDRKIYDIVQFYTITNKILDNFLFNNEKTIELFWEHLKKKNENIYYATKGFYFEGIQEKNNATISFNNINENDSYENALKIIRNYSLSPNEDTLNEMLKLDINHYLYLNLFSKHLSSLIENRKYEESQYIYKKMSKKIKDPSIEYFDFLYYFSTYKHKDALYKLNIIKDDINFESYNYFKSIINYRLGYKNASKKYMNNVNDIKMASMDIFTYIDIMGLDNLSLLELNIEENSLNLMKIEYYIIKNDIYNAKKIFKELKDKKDIDPIFLDTLEVSIEWVQNKEKAILIAKNLYEKNKTSLYGNNYAYYLALSNKNLNEANEIIDKYLDEDQLNYYDTKAFILHKLNRNEEALSLYENHNMLLYNNAEVQKNISNIYKSLGDYKKSKKHLTISKELFHK